MTNLIVAAAGFVLLHLAVSGTPVRDRLVGAIGARAYMAAFSLASVGLLVWLGLGYAAAKGDLANRAYWSATPLTKDIQLALQFLAVTLVVIGLTTPNPTSVGQQGTLDRPDVARGILRITRHPFLWGVAIWAAGHLLVNGDIAGLILFGSMLALAGFGTASIDAKRRRALGPAWDAFAAQTSNIPFGAIVAGRQSLNIGEIGWWRLALAPAVWVALIAIHPYAFGVSPLPR